MFALVLAAAAQVAAQQPLGPVLFSDLRYGETLQDIRARHKASRFLDSITADDLRVTVTPRCTVYPLLRMGVKTDFLRAVELQGVCGTDVLAMMTEKYGSPLAGADSPLSFHRFSGVTKQTTYIWHNGDVAMTLVLATTTDAVTNNHFTLTYTLAGSNPL